MRLDKMIRERPKDVSCESIVGEDGKHAGVIFLSNKEGGKEVLGKTDPIFEKAEDAAKAAEASVKHVKATNPIFKNAEKPKPKKKGEKK